MRQADGINHSNQSSSPKKRSTCAAGATSYTSPGAAAHSLTYTQSRLHAQSDAHLRPLKPVLWHADVVGPIERGGHLHECKCNLKLCLIAQVLARLL
eukprot:2752663-Prymnesium_polylepis.3